MGGNAVGASPTSGTLPVSSRRRRLARKVWNLLAPLPALADRPGFRWLLSGRLVGAPIVVLTHRGRTSGRLYRTPVEAIAEMDEEVVVSPMRGARADWYRNVQAGGLVEATLRGESVGRDWRELAEPERRAALERYLGDHPAYGRAVLRALARLHGLEGSMPREVAAIPMLALRRTAS
jgi:deazaflavin-dependent oxidoreductase (nitroreductase family)